jgi:hypothetical protein
MNMEYHELEERMRNAIQAFIEKDVDLLRQDAKEEAITTQLKYHLENEFKDWKWHIDHQYDRRVIESQVVQKRTNFVRNSLPKDKIPKGNPPELEIINKQILPDIIFHDRNSNQHNFIVIEVKLSTNKRKVERDFDILKLEVMTSIDLKYEWGIFIDFSSGDEFNPENPYLIRFVSKGHWL